MNTKKMFAVLEIAQSNLGEAKGTVGPAQIPEWIEAVPFHDVTVVDEAIRTYASTRKWPALENDQKAQLHLRLQSAMELLAALPSKGPGPNDEEHALHMLLIDYWHGKGIDWCRYRFRA